MSERRRKKLLALFDFASETALGRIRDIIAGAPTHDRGDVDRVVEAANGNRLAGTAYRNFHGEMQRAVIWFAESLRLAKGPQSERIGRSQAIWEAVSIILGYHVEQQIVASLAADVGHNDPAETEWAREFHRDSARRADMALGNMGLTPDRCPEIYDVLIRLRETVCDLYDAVGRSAHGARFETDCRPPFRPVEYSE